MTLLISKVKNRLKNQYYLESPDKGVLRISTSKDSLPLAIVIDDSGLSVSFTLDYVEPAIVADLMLSLIHIYPVRISESFYITKNGDMTFGEEAEKRFEIDFLIDLENTAPENDLVN